MTPTCYWFTGLPCAGKTTLAWALADRLPNAVVLDGDELRTGLCADLGFSPDDRDENIRRVGHVAKLLWQAGHDVCCAFVSPYRRQRAAVRSLFPADAFIEVFVQLPAEQCAERDVKGMWAKARAGEIEGFTGYDAPYEEPTDPEFVACTDGAPAHVLVGWLLEAYAKDAEPADVFIGRWAPFHNGHLALIEAARGTNDRPVLVLVRNTAYDYWPARERRGMVQAALIEAGIPCDVRVIPDIAAIHYGRGVGYEVNAVEVPDDVQAVSGTQIRTWLADGDPRWRDHVPSAVATLLEST